MLTDNFSRVVICAVIFLWNLYKVSEKIHKKSCSSAVYKK